MTKTKPETYTVYEFGGFTCGKRVGGYQSLPPDTFAALESFVLENRTRTDYTDYDGADTIELMGCTSKKGIGEILTARNYVGTVTLKDGTVIEILPKIGKNIGAERTKEIFLRMLAALPDMNFKLSEMANLDTRRMNIYEIFIRMFLQEALGLARQGLRSGYTRVERNECFCKGRLLMDRHVRRNAADAAHFYVTYKKFTPNRPENRLLKSTVLLLLKQTSQAENNRLCRELLTHLEAVEESRDIDGDFAKCVKSRATVHYEKALNWCRVFLKRKSFTAFSGEQKAFALLFPMERVFESYVVRALRRSGLFRSVLEQDESKSLFTDGGYLRPDIVAYRRGDAYPLIMDTKWKVPADRSKISNADLYQMYAYGARYKSPLVLLLYPLAGADPHFKPYHTHKGAVPCVTVAPYFVDLEAEEATMAKSIFAAAKQLTPIGAGSGKP
jgi:5-methylcytosine-specific restriction enzyme subunit McrC